MTGAHPSNQAQLAYAPQRKNTDLFTISAWFESTDQRSSPPSGINSSLLALKTILTQKMVFI